VALYGILNGTSNFILSEIEKNGAEFGTVLAEAQRLGYAEADPTADVDGHDAAAKLVVLSGIAFRRFLRLGEIPKHSIRQISSADFRYARRLGCTIRQLSQVEATEDGFYACVGPALVPINSSFGRNEGANNVVSIFGRYGGESAFSGAGAGGPATAVAVVSDLLALTGRERNRSVEKWEPAGLATPPTRPYYVRFVVHDQPGILAAIAASLARQHVNVDALLQEPGFPKDRLPFVITVEPCEETALRTAISEISSAEWHAEAPLALPMLPGANS
jgi:homoserine dehydrogenase